MTGRYQEGYVAGARKTRQELEAEIERLRMALTEIADTEARNGHVPSGYEAVAIARKALSRQCPDNVTDEQGGK